MGSWRTYVNHFFDELEMYEDVARGNKHKAYLRQAVIEFLQRQSKETAFGVYRSFFDSYRIKLEGKSNPFIDLLDVLLSYEERASTLIDKQRDHYVHSVNVFILGLCVYSENSRFREDFGSVNLDKLSYPFSYDTKGEEFFYRWGIASLFHDVGYPVEIIGKQLNKFINFAAEIDQQGQVRAHLEFDNFDEFNSIAEVQPKEKFTGSYAEKYKVTESLDLLKPIDLLAHKLHLSLGLDLETIKSDLESFPKRMANHGFIDHGYYSAIIVLRWYGYLIQICNYKPAYFFNPILDSASAILLHNYYKNVLMKAPFNKSPLSPKDHPIAYLLILCDELQEWNRAPYGILDKQRNQAEQAQLLITDLRLEMTYIDTNGVLPDGFAKEKESTLVGLLELATLFPDGVSISCQSTIGFSERPWLGDTENVITPRLLLDDLEELASAIHDFYNEKQLERNPNKPLAYPDFSDLPEELKYSNLRQARSIEKKLRMMGWEIRGKDSEGEVIKEIPKSAVEVLARFEHEDWVTERTKNGWVYGASKDVDNKISPFLVPYDDLSEEIKDLDRDAIRAIPRLLDKVGMAVYRSEIVDSSPYSKSFVARRLPFSYKD